MLKKKTTYIGLGLTAALALFTLILGLRFFHNSRMDAANLYHAGMDTLGAFICVVLFYGCMRQVEHSTRSFNILVIMASASFALNELMWFTVGASKWRTLYFACCLLSKWINLAMIYFFFLYVRGTLRFNGRLAKWADRFFPVLLILFMLVVLANVFVPVSFFVNADGIYGRTDLSWLEDLYLIIVSSVTTVLICQSVSPRRQKWAAMSFILIPIAEFLASGGAFAFAAQYGAVLLSLILMYCVLFNDRSRKLAATQTELTLATRIQENMLPNIFPAFPDRAEFDIYATMDPAAQVGGDFYDFFLIDDTHLGLVIADVSGKGVPAALFMMISKILVQNYAMTGRSPAEVLKAVNDQICTNNREEMFVTVWFGILETTTGKITAANAGHECPAVIQTDGRFDLMKDKHGFIVGGMENIRYKEYEMTLKPGSKLFVYTDGVPEATNASNEMFGTGRMLDALNKDPAASPQMILRHVREAVDDFVKGAEQFDDITMMCVEYKGMDKSSAADNKS